MSSKVTVLSKEQLCELYSKLAGTHMAKLTKEAVEKGCSIALVEKEGLKRSKNLTYDIQVALEHSVPRSSVIKVWCYTDMSQLKENKIYVAFKELENHACAHASDADHCRISD